MKLDTKRTIFVGFAFMAICAFWQIYDSIVPLILKNTFDLNDAVSGIIMAMDNVVAVFLLPVFARCPTGRIHASGAECRISFSVCSWPLR